MTGVTGDVRVQVFESPGDSAGRPRGSVESSAGACRVRPYIHICGSAGWVERLLRVVRGRGGVLAEGRAEHVLGALLRGLVYERERAQ